METKRWNRLERGQACCSLAPGFFAFSSLLYAPFEETAGVGFWLLQLDIQSFNVGLDFAFLKDRLHGSFDWYVRKTKNMIGNAPELPSILGTAVPVTNNTDLRTNGWELTIGWNDRLSNGLQYGISLNLSDAYATITRYPNNPSHS